MVTFPYGTLMLFYHSRVSIISGVVYCKISSLNPLYSPDYNGLTIPLILICYNSPASKSWEIPRHSISLLECKTTVVKNSD